MVTFTTRGSAAVASRIRQRKGAAHQELIIVVLSRCLYLHIVFVIRSGCIRLANQPLQSACVVLKLRLVIQARIVVIEHDPVHPALQFQSASLDHPMHPHTAFIQLRRRQTASTKDFLQLRVGEGHLNKVARVAREL